jgi:hypothetical protein
MMLARNLSQSVSKRGGSLGRRPAAQVGMSFLGILVVVIVVVSAMTLVMKLGPHYIDFYAVKSVIEDLPAQKVHEMSRQEILESLQKRFKVNNLRDFKVVDILKIERGRDETVLQVDYEQREHLVANVDIVLSFSEQFTYQ